VDPRVSLLLYCYSSIHSLIYVCGV
jgi:hypothetical protein